MVQDVELKTQSRITVMHAVVVLALVSSAVAVGIAYNSSRKNTATKSSVGKGFAFDEPYSQTPDTLFSDTQVLVKVKSGVVDFTAVAKKALTQPLDSLVEVETGNVLQRKLDVPEQPTEDSTTQITPRRVQLKTVEQLAPKLKSTATRRVPVSELDQWQVVSVQEPADIYALIRRLQALPEVATVEPDIMLQLSADDGTPGGSSNPDTIPGTNPPSTTPNDYYFNTDTGQPPVYSWNQKDNNNLPYADLWGLKTIGFPQAWSGTIGSPTSVVAVIDTGVDYSHPDLAQNIWQNTGEVGTDANGNAKQSNGLDDDANGYVDDWHGWDFAMNDNDPMDPHGHGTHVSGTIAATTNNAIGVAGVCQQCKVMALKIADDSGSLLSSKAIAAFRYAADNGARITSNSWGSAFAASSIDAAIQYAYGKDVLSVFAAGNSSMDTQTFFPRINEILTVGAWAPEDALAIFSNIGDRVDVVAPGVDILSLRAAGTNMYGDNLHTIGADSNYYRASGTSMAAPHVAGLAGLIASQHLDYGPEQIRQAIRQGADDKGAAGWDRQSGYGRINATKTFAVPATCAARILKPRIDEGLASLSAPNVPITGVATCPSFSKYTIEYGTGLTPSAWTKIGESTSPVTNGTLLGTWTPSALARGAYTLRLTVTDTTGHANIDRTPFLISFPQYSGFPYGGSVQSFDQTSLLAGDVNADGKAEAIYHHEAVDSTGNLLPGWPPAMSHIRTGALGDVLPSSPGSEYVVADDYKLHMYRANGTEVTSENWPKTFATKNYSYPVAIADLDRDGTQEIIFGENKVAIHVYNGDGVERSGFPVVGNSVFSVGDVDTDPNIEIVAYTGNIIHSNGSVTTLPGRPGGAYLGDVDGDGKFNLVTFGASGNYTTGEYAAVVKSYAPTGEETVWETQTTQARSVYFPQFIAVTYPTLGDVDGDNLADITYSSGDSLYLLLGSSKKLAPGYPVPLTGTQLTQPLLVNLDGDPQMEIVAHTYSGFVYAYNADGTSVVGFPFADVSHGLFSTYWGAAPAFADVRGNGTYDMITAELGISEQVIREYKVDATDVEWGMFRKNAQHNFSNDSDGDGIYDPWERVFGLDIKSAAGNTTDTDGDGLTAMQEFLKGAKPNSVDSDGDGIRDNVEVQQGSDPGNIDSPNDHTPPIIQSLVVTPVTNPNANLKTATVTFTTSETSTATIAYGTTTSYGTQTTMTPLQSTFSLTLSGLQPATTYHVKVTAADATGNTRQSADVSIATGACTESWSCNSWAVCTNGQKTRTCTDANACGTTISKPVITQACTAPTCTEAWSCSPWSTCVNNQQSRSCSDLFACGTTVQKPTTTQACESGFPACTPAWTCTVWGTCTNGVQSRSCVDTNGCNTTSGKPATSASCSVPTCVENWSCSGWSSCVYGSQQRTCSDRNACGTTTGKPLESNGCSNVAPIQTIVPNAPSTQLPVVSSLRIENITRRTFTRTDTGIRRVTTLVTGKGFTNSMKAYVGSLRVGVTYKSPTTVELKFNTNAFAAGKYALKFRIGPKRWVTIDNAIIIQGKAPVITSFSPNTFKVSTIPPYTSVTITGKNFTRKSQVYIGGKAIVQTTYVSATRLVAVFRQTEYVKDQKFSVIVRNPDDLFGKAKLTLKAR